MGKRQSSRRHRLLGRRRCVRQVWCLWCGVEVTGEGGWPEVGPPWPICCTCDSEDTSREFGWGEDRDE